MADRYVDRVSVSERVVGLVLGFVALGLMAWQVVREHDNTLEFVSSAAYLVVLLTAVCMVLTYFEATVYGGTVPLYSMFVIATGLVATFGQSALLAVLASTNQSYALASWVLVLQLAANSVMLALIFLPKTRMQQVFTF